MKRLRILNFIFVTLLLVFFQNCDVATMGDKLGVGSSQGKPGCNNGGGYSGNNCDRSSDAELSYGTLPVRPDISFSDQVQVRILAPVELECVANFENIERMKDFDWDYMLARARFSIDDEEVIVPRFAFDEAEQFAFDYSIVVLDCELNLSLVKNEELPDQDYVESVTIDGIEYAELDFMMPILRTSEE